MQYIMDSSRKECASLLDLRWPSYIPPDPPLACHLPGRRFPHLTDLERSNPSSKFSTMRFSTLALATGLTPLAFAHPLERRQNALPNAKSTADEAVLQLANYLENLEHELYTEGYERFSDAEYTAAGFPPGFRENVGVIAQVYPSTFFDCVSLD